MSRLMVKNFLKSTATALAVVAALMNPLAGVAQAGPSQAGPSDVELVTSVWCDTAEQVESVYRAHFAQGLTIEAAVAKTNMAAAQPAACAAVSALVVEAGEARRFVAGNQMMSLSRFVVVGFVKDGRATQIRPQMQFTGKVIARLMDA